MLFGTLQKKDFLDRKEELFDLYQRFLGAEKGIPQSVFLSGAPGIGKTELLKQLFSLLFWKQSKVVPCYYSINDALLSADTFSADYLKNFICQRLAFARKEQSLLYLQGLSIEGLAALLERQHEAWAQDILDRYRQSSGNPLDALRIALHAPLQSGLATGNPVVVMIDEFQRLRNLHIHGVADPRLVSLFEELMSFQRTTHVVSGNESEIREMPIIGGLVKMHVGPLRFGDASSLFLSMLHSQGTGIESVPHAVIHHLGGNPFYIRSIALVAGLWKINEEQDFWRAYIRDITNGNIYHYWSSVLKNAFPDVSARKYALEVAYLIHQEQETITASEISKMFPVTDTYAETVVSALFRSGVVVGEFGVFRVPDDQVLNDLVTCLYQREILGKSYDSMEAELLEKITGEERKGVSFEMVLPMVKDAELIAAQGLEQIGKNLNIHEDTVGQLQIAVIEACINAIEYGGDEDKRIYLRFDYDPTQLQVSVESEGGEFISLETGEPGSPESHEETAGRGWGIKIMRKFVDSVRFKKSARGTKVVLVKKLARAAERQQAGESIRGE